MDKTVDKTEAMILEIEKNHVLYEKADKDYKDIMKKKRHMESNWTESRTDRYVIEINFNLPVSTYYGTVKRNKCLHEFIN